MLNAVSNYFPASLRQPLARQASLLGLIALCLAWLVPNKNFPWLSAWNEGLALIGCLLLSIAALTMPSSAGTRAGRVAWPLHAVVCLGMVTVWLQWLTGLLVFRGDAVLVSLYLGCFWLAISASARLSHGLGGAAWLDGWMAVVALAGLVTVGIALNQWTGTHGLAIWVQEVGANGRPYANLGQINHVNTLCFIAGCSLLQLHARKQLRFLVLLAGLVLLGFGMALTQSRTAIVQILVLLLWSGWQYRSLSLRRNTAIFFGLAYVFWATLMSSLASVLLLKSARPIGIEATMTDLRISAWKAMGDAIMQHPWRGYGWLQNSWAQQLITERHPELRYEFNYAHNFVVDLMLWVGVPLGTMMTGMLAWWALKHIRSRNPATAYILGAIAGIFVHGLLEYPLSYTYFLIPLGLFIGAADALNPVFRRAITLHRTAMVATVSAIILLLQIGKEYTIAIEADTVLRTEALKIGAAGKITPPPELYVLDQLGAQLHFRFIDPTPAMRTEDLNLMRRVAQRYGTYASLTDYAYAMGLNGEAEISKQYLDIVCTTYGEGRCVRNMEEWARRRLSTGGRLDIYINAPSSLPQVSNGTQ